MLRLVTPPEEPVVSLAEAKAHLRIFHDDDNDYVSSLVDAATDNLDGASGWLGLALAPQEWEYSTDAFPCGKALRLPLAPLLSVEAVSYTAADGSDAVFSDFRASGIGTRQPGYVVRFGDSWPVIATEMDAVRVTFKCGFADASGIAAVPTAIKHAILLMVGHWYENREAVTETKVTDLPMAVASLLNPYRNWLS